MCFAKMFTTHSPDSYADKQMVGTIFERLNNFTTVQNAVGMKMAKWWKKYIHTTYMRVKVICKFPGGKGYPRKKIV